MTKKPELVSLGKVIRERREALGISQEELGYLASLHRTYIGSVERGEKNISMINLIRVANALQTLPHTLLEKANL